jgi:hypothetical protein
MGKNEGTHDKGSRIIEWTSIYERSGTVEGGVISTSWDGVRVPVRWVIEIA